MAHMKLSVARTEAERIMNAAQPGHIANVKLVVQHGRHFVTMGRATMSCGHSWDDSITRLLFAQAVMRCGILGVEPPTEETFEQVCERFFNGTLNSYPKKSAQPKDASVVASHIFTEEEEDAKRKVRDAITNP